MAKICLISDIHWGVHKSSKVFYSSQERYFTKELIPYLVENNIKDLYILGDMWDNRESTNNKVQNIVYHIFELLDEHDIKVTMLIGNHDTQYKTNIDFHSLKYLSLFPNVTIIDRITETEIDGLSVTMFPWQTDDLFTTKTYNGDIAFGHFDIAGCLLNKSTIQEAGISQQWFFKNFNKTFSGHYHTQSEYSDAAGNEIIYLGAPYHLNRNDINSNRGVVILDTDTLEFERVYSKTPLKYISAIYPKPIEDIDIPNNIIDIHVNVTDKFDSKELNEYIYAIENNADGLPVNVNVVPHYENISLDHDDIDQEKLNKVKSIPDMVKLKLEEMDISDDMRKEVDEYVNKIYTSLHTI
jgi:DNA repair exonuclease SbcCD nuclease subunit